MKAETEIKIGGILGEIEAVEDFLSKVDRVEPEASGSTDPTQDTDGGLACVLMSVYREIEENVNDDGPARYEPDLVLCPASVLVAVVSLLHGKITPKQREILPALESIARRLSQVNAELAGSEQPAQATA